MPQQKLSARLGGVVYTVPVCLTAERVAKIEAKWAPDGIVDLDKMSDASDELATQAERRTFLGLIHGAAGQPITPGREARLSKASEPRKSVSELAAEHAKQAFDKNRNHDAGRAELNASIVQASKPPPTPPLQRMRAGTVAPLGLGRAALQPPQKPYKW